MVSFVPMHGERIGNLSESISKAGLISFDIDSVMIDPAPIALKQFNEILGTEYKLADLDEYFIMTKWLIEAGWDEKVARAQDEAIWNSHRTLFGSGPVPGASATIRALESLGVKPLFITSRPSSREKHTIFQFERYFPWVERSQILVQTDTDKINSGFKVDEIRKNNVSVHFDDSIDHAERIVKETSSLVVLVRNYQNAGYESTNDRILVPEKGLPISVLISLKVMANHFGLVAQY